MSSISEDLSASLEDYLEAIYHIVEEKQVARVRDIARKLKVQNPSVTGALQALSEKQLVNYAPYDVITLTEKGTEVARNVVRKHEVLRDFFTNVLFVDDKCAEEGACRMEHAVPRLIVNRLIHLVDFAKDSQEKRDNWMEAFRDYCANRKG